MPKIHIKNGGVILKDGILENSSVIIDGAKILYVGGDVKSPKGAVIIDAKKAFISPGFIDCHIHGEPGKIFANEARYGTTAFVIAQSCAPLDHIYKKAKKIKEFIRSSPLGGNVLGVRLEGPYINKVRAGAQDISCIRNPDIKEFYSIIAKLSPILKIMTIAPELKNAGPVIRSLVKNNIIASIGHSDATYGAALEGISAGITHATHTFNAMSPLDRREPGVVGAVLMDDRVTAEVILDLIHVHRALFELLLRLKKKDKVIIVTDSLTSDVPKETKKTGGAYRFSDGRLAGSSLTMIAALKHAVTSCNLKLSEALRLITINPAKLLGVEGSKGSVEAGKDADIVIFDKEFDVKMTIIRGRIVYRKSL